MKITLAFIIVLVGATAGQNVNVNLDIDWPKIKQCHKFVNINPNVERNITSSANNIQTRVVGGKPARLQQFPYQIGLNTREPNGTFWCGGSLISRNYVLTVAHCLYDGISTIVILGAVNVCFSEIGQARIRVPKANFIIHSSYDGNHNDIALIRLPNPASLSDYIQLIALPKANIKTTDRNAIASGWGSLKDGGKTSSRLRYVKLRTIPLDNCLHFYHSGLVTNGNVCTDSSNGKTPCDGDSGGPLVVKENGVKTLIGLTSFGSDRGCQEGAPEVYTRVSSYLNWIQNNSDVIL